MALHASAHASTLRMRLTAPVARVQRMPATKARANVRMADDSLPLPEWVQNVGEAEKTVASLAGIIAVDIALRRTFVARAIPFPSSLAGMLGLFGSLCTMQAIRPALAGTVVRAAAPGCAFISRWLALFFVPNLVVLPLVLTMSLSEISRLIVLIVAGLAVSLPVCALAASAVLKSQADAATEPAPAAAPARPANFLTSPSLKLLIATSTISGAVAIAAQRFALPGSTVLKYAFPIAWHPRVLRVGHVLASALVISQRPNLQPLSTRTAAGTSI